jgi:type I restriction enzyme S subunit
LRTVTLVVITKGEVADWFSAVIADVIAQQQTIIFQTQNLRRTHDLLLPRLLSGQINVEAIRVPGSPFVNSESARGMAS